MPCRTCSKESKEIFENGYCKDCIKIVAKFLRRYPFIETSFVKKVRPDYYDGRIVRKTLEIKIDDTLLVEEIENAMQEL